MTVCLSHFTALSYWREHFPVDAEANYPKKPVSLKRYSFGKADVLNCVPESWIEPDQPVDILIFDAAHNRRSKGVNPHAWGFPVPNNALYMDRDACISSPEFLFLQMASCLSVAQLVALGCELCGYYVLLPRGHRNVSAIDDFPTRVAPLTSIDAIKSFLEAVKPASAGRGPKGLTKAKRAIKYVVEGSRSPMETMTYMLLCLPPMLGGYGLPQPVMNEQILLDSESAVIARRERCFGDICWFDKKLDIEYYGSVHAGFDKVQDDAGRVLGIEHMDWKVITLTSPQVLDIDRFEVVAKEVAKRLGRKLHPRIVGETQPRAQLREEMDDWMFA